MKDANYIILDGSVAHSVGEFKETATHETRKGKPPVEVKISVETQLIERADALGIATPRFMTVAQYEKSARHKAILVEGLAAAIRAERNARMVASDWTQLPDVIDRFPPPNRDAWAAYRKQVMYVARVALDNATPADSIEWPAEPE